MHPIPYWLCSVWYLRPNAIYPDILSTYSSCIQIMWYYNCSTLSNLAVRRLISTNHCYMNTSMGKYTIYYVGFVQNTKEIKV